jgi:hypothetical protein
LQAKVRGNGGGGNAMLAGSGFRNDARLSHFHCEKSLANGVIDFVRAGMEQVFALKVNARPA